MALSILVLMTDNTSAVHTLDRGGRLWRQLKIIHSFTKNDFITEQGSRILVGQSKIMNQEAPIAGHVWRYD